MNIISDSYNELKQVNGCYTVESSRIDDYIKAINDLNVSSVYICDLYNDLCNLDYLKECPNIESVNINSKYVNDVKGLEKLRSLKTLIIQDINCIIDLSLIPSIEELSFTWSKNQTNLASLQNIRCLSIWNYKTKSIGLEELMFAKRLEELKLVKPQINSLKMIDEFKYLKTFELLYASKLTSLESLFSSKTIRSVSFENCKNIIDFYKLANMKQLEKISICKSGALESISFINDLPKLKWFVCLNTKILDCNLTPSRRLEYSAFDKNKEYFFQ